MRLILLTFLGILTVSVAGQMFSFKSSTPLKSSASDQKKKATLSSGHFQNKVKEAFAKYKLELKGDDHPAYALLVEHQGSILTGTMGCVGGRIAGGLVKSFARFALLV